MFDIFNMLKKEENAAPKQVTRDTIIGDILDMDQSTAPYFMEIGMHCLGCPASRGESIEEACAVHGVDCDELIEKLNEHEQPIVFLLWGGNARSKKKLITAPQHLVLESVHPSPLSAYNGFFGCKHFSKCNAFLEAHGIDPIDWDLNH